MNDAFELIVLGCSGGPFDRNLSGYLLSRRNDLACVALDAGSLLSGLEMAEASHHLDSFPIFDSKYKPPIELMRHHLKAYLISHAHLDHIAGLVINSQIDTPKTIAGIDPTIDNLRDHIFNGRIWPNYGDEGIEPQLAKYHYHRLPLHQPCPLAETSFTVEAFLLSHPRGYPSTAFLLENRGEYVLYFGDTSSDSLEIEKHIERIWSRVAPLHRSGKLRGILLESSFPREEADQAIYGHLDTKLTLRELHHLASFTEDNLEGLKVVITHRKLGLKKGVDAHEKIAHELQASSDLDCSFIFPKQGDRITL